MKLQALLATRPRRHLSMIVCGLVAVFLLSGAAFAHGGEDHGDEQKAAEPGTATRVVATSELFEAVGVPTAAGGGKLLISLSDFWTNKPIEGAKIDVINGDKTTAATYKNGLYEVPAPWVKTPGHYELTFSVNAGEKSDLLIGSLEISAAAHEEAHESIWDHLLPKTFSHGHAEQGAAILDLPDNARRLADGSVFMPKTTQALLGVATAQARITKDAQRTVSFAGLVIADPNKSGLVQSLLSGRIEPPETGFPAIGASVKAGDILGYLTPKVELVDQSDIRQTTGDLDRQIRLAESKVARYDKLKNVIAEALITDAHLELEGLKARRAEIKPVLGEREALKAPASGIIAQANVTAGQVVDAQALLFQIIDPESLWVEALAFDVAAAADVERRGEDAVGTASDGKKLQLAFAGRGLSLRQQAVPLRYRIKGSGAGLSLGQPVTVAAPLEELINAIPVPRSSVVRAPNGQSVVLVHTAPERFEQRAVTTVPIDADRLGITAGLDADARVVVRGAELINQVR
jgi:cobalt-zinc-cadmium efflux system membrane fusion protein